MDSTRSDKTQALYTSHGLCSFFSAKFYEDALDVRGFTRGAGTLGKNFTISSGQRKTGACRMQSRGLAQEYYKNVLFAERSVSQ